MATRSRPSSLSGESDRSSGRFPALPTSSVSASMDAPIPRRPHTGTLVPSASDPALADPGTASLLSRHHSLNRLDKLVNAIQAVDRAQPHPSALPSRRTKKKRLGIVRSSVGNKATFPVSEFRPLQQFLLRDGGGKSNFPHDMAREDAPSTLHSTSMEWNVSTRPTLSAPLPSQFPYTSSEMLESRLKVNGLMFFSLILFSSLLLCMCMCVRTREDVPIAGLVSSFVFYAILCCVYVCLLWVGLLWGEIFSSTFGIV